MRIAMIGQKGIPSRTGGVEIHVEELAKRLVRLGNSVTVYCRRTYCDEINQSYQGISLKYIPSIATKHLDAITYTLLATFHALFHGFDIFHYHALGPSTAAFLPHMFGKKVVCTIHGLDWQRAKWGRLAKKYLQIGEYIIAKCSDKSISVSKKLVNYFSDKYHKEPVYIPNGVNIPVKRQAQLIIQKYNLEKDNYLLYLGRLVPEKGVHYLIEAYKKLSSEKKLVIAGGSSHTEYYVKKLKTMAAGCENIIFTGFIKGQVLEELFSNAYLFILPSDIEGMPISLLEAMSYGRVCLVSDIDENRAALGKNGFYFSKGNIETLCNVLKDLLHGNYCLQSYKDAALNYVKTNFSWDDVAQCHNRLYTDLLFSEDKTSFTNNGL